MRRGGGGVEKRGALKGPFEFGGYKEKALGTTVMIFNTIIVMKTIMIIIIGRIVI